ncbi:putative efflux protein, MATE family [Palleronia marisminoris]|uniref:Multidrug export protein MepA n=1 Tax=Palleronia marisminoris TaxID=315423 RepID=A0A1Y5TC56_9RHOB|nr:MATE family efflux transporter [Palleronia marisminoris]SFH33856.1 putative efflux protein, MATE family [Palleronia marisminoris]SLN60283.1 Multidrug export protein MepA [Palleronia marisminoris]
MSDRSLTDGSISRAVLSVSAPMVLGIFGVLAVGLADAYFLARVGQTQLAAVGYIYPVTVSVTSLSIGLAAGANAALSQSIGAGTSEDETHRMGLHALGLGLVVGVVVGTALWALQGPIFGLIGAKGPVTDEIADYVFWWAMSFPFLVLSMLVGAMFRARGDGVTASIIMANQAATNIALDPLLIFGLGPFPEMSTGGAGLATFLVRVGATVGGIWWAWRKGHLSTARNPFEQIGRSVRRIGEVGLPAAISNAINPAGMAMVTAAVATLGEAAVAGFGAATRVQSLAIVPLLALSSGIGPVVGQNWGAQRTDRARGAVRVTFLMCGGYGACVGTVLMLFGGPIASAVASGPDDAAVAAVYLRIVGLSLFGYGVLVTGNAAMNARSKAMWSMGLSAARIFAVYLPLAWLLVGLFGFAGIAAAAATANVAAALAMVWATRTTGLSPLADRSELQARSARQ